MDVNQRGLSPDVATESNSLGVIVVTAVMTFLATVAITLRIYGCLFILRRRLYFEEWLSVINQVSSCAYPTHSIPASLQLRGSCLLYFLSGALGTLHTLTDRLPID